MHVIVLQQLISQHHAQWYQGPDVQKVQSEIKRKNILKLPNLPVLKLPVHHTNFSVFPCSLKLQLSDLQPRHHLFAESFLGQFSLRCNKVAAIYLFVGSLSFTVNGNLHKGINLAYKSYISLKNNNFSYFLSLKINWFKFAKTIKWRFFFFFWKVKIQPYVLRETETDSRLYFIVKLVLFWIPGPWFPSGSDLKVEMWCLHWQERQTEPKCQCWKLCTMFHCCDDFLSLFS